MAYIQSNGKIIPVTEYDNIRVYPLYATGNIKSLNNQNV